MSDKKTIGFEELQSSVHFKIFQFNRKLPITFLISFLVTFFTFLFTLHIDKDRSVSFTKDKVFLFFNHYKSNLASQLLIYNTYGIKPDQALAHHVQEFDQPSKVAVKNNRGNCIMGDCDIFKSKSSYFNFFMKDQLSVAEESVGEIAFMTKLELDLKTTIMTLIALVFSCGTLLLVNKFIFSEFLKLAAQISHDIRSPIAALSFIRKDLLILPEDTKAIAMGAMDQITDIANSLLMNKNNLLKKSGTNWKNFTSFWKKNVKSILISHLVSQLLAEKRMEYMNRSGVTIQLEIEKSVDSVFVRVNESELKRVISNLINNSIDAIEDQGTVTVHLNSDSSLLYLTVKDTGKGIPADLIKKIGTRAFSFGKQNGNGLGLYHAKKTISSFGGVITFSSQENIGTVIQIKLPKTQETL